MLPSLAADDAAGKARIAAFLQEFQLLGWTDGRNVRVDIRWSASHADDIRKYAAELVVLLAQSGHYATEFQWLLSGVKRTSLGPY